MATFNHHLLAKRYFVQNRSVCRRRYQLLRLIISALWLLHYLRILIGISTANLSNCIAFRSKIPPIPTIYTHNLPYSIHMHLYTRLLFPPHLFPIPSRPLIPTPSILHTPLPTDPRQKIPLNNSHQPQRNRHSSPEPIQPPPQPEGRAHANRHRDHIVAKQLHVPAHLLPAEPAQDAVAAGGEGVEELERGAEWEDLGDERDHGGVAGEELGDVVSEG